MKKIYQWFINLLVKYKRKRKFNKKLEELRKKDPFIYNH
jgi:hypothetical protein